MNQKNMYQEIESLIINKKGKAYWKMLIKYNKQKEQKIFMDGYKYAIQILKDGLKK